MISVAIADDHPLMREGIKRVLKKEIDLEVCGEASDGKELLSLLNKLTPDLAILDITMPGKSGLDLIKDVRTLFPKLSILVLSIHPAERFAVRALKAGANGYLCKSGISDELVNAIRKIVTQKRRYITGDVAEQLAMQMGENQSPTHETLSDREFEVLCMIAEGNDITTIANQLSLSPHTIHTYRSRIKKKMNLSSNVDMTRYAMENDLIT